MKRLLACLVALVLTLLPCAAMAEGYALYALDNGFSVALPDASWFHLDAQTYTQYQATHGETFAEMTIRDADTAQSYADKGMECFFAPDDAGLSIVVQHSNLTMDDEIRVTVIATGFDDGPVKSASTTAAMRSEASEEKKQGLFSAAAEMASTAAPAPVPGAAPAATPAAQEESLHQDEDPFDSIFKIFNSK